MLGEVMLECLSNRLVRVNVIALISLLTFAPLVNAAETIRLANGEWAPFQSQHLKHSGFISHVIKESFELEGYVVKFEYMPWKRGYRQARYGVLDGTFVWGKTSEREEQFYFSDVVINLTTSIFHQTGKEIVWNNIEDLGKYRIGGVIGYDYELSEYEKSGAISITRKTSLEGILKMLAKDRLDIVFSDVDVGLYSVNQLGLQNEIIVSDKKINENKSFYLLISKEIENGEEIIEKFNQGLKILKQSGKFEKFQEDNRKGEYILK